MRRVWMLSVALLAGSVAAALPAQQTDYSHVRIVRLSLVEGDVQIAQPGEADWQTALLNRPIPHGSVLATGNGHAEVEFENGTTVWLAGNSSLQFTELALAGGARITRLRLTQGTATFYGNPSREDTFVVATPHVEIALHEKGTFRVDVDAQETAVSVWSGELQVFTAAGNYQLRKGRTLIFGGGMQQALVERNPDEDAWDRWVEDRRNLVLTGRNQVGRYVSTGYAYGLHDLWHYGYWFTLPGFGHCWRPWGVSHTWSPFSFGRWVYYPGLGLTWISFEPWGWVPYHFGSWYYSPANGWCWVPDSFHYWHPGVVYWVRVGNQIGWVPRSPLDRDGRPPANLERGIGGVINRQLRLGTGNEDVEILPEPPGQGIAGVIQRQLLQRQQTEGRATAGGTATAGASGATTLTNPAPRPPRPATEEVGVRSRILRTQRGEQPAITYDPLERRWVNEAIREQRTEAATQQPRGISSRISTGSSADVRTERPTTGERPAIPPRIEPVRPAPAPQPLPAPATNPAGVGRPTPPRPTPPPEAQRPQSPSGTSSGLGGRVNRPQSPTPPRPPEPSMANPVRPQPSPPALERPAPPPRPANAPRPSPRPAPSPHIH
jgi:hypothetical protein